MAMAVAYDPEKKPGYFRPRAGKALRLRLGRNIPRRSRVLLLAAVVAFALWLFPETRAWIGSVLSSFLISGDHDGLGRGRRSSPRDVLRYVDPLIGTTNGGHVFPGASLPYGMAKAVADTNSPNENAAGYVSDNYSIVGFTHMHDSGTGGSASMGQFPIFVHPGCPNDDFHECNFGRNERQLQRVQDSVVASPGYFSIQLENQVVAEMTVTEHVALYRFGFPGTPVVDTPDGEVPYSPLLLMDLSDLSMTRSSGAVSVDDETGRIVGEGIYRPSFGMGEYHAYFCADFRGADIKETGTFMSNKASAVDKVLNGTGSSFRLPGGIAGGWLHFTPPTDNEIFARVGLSFLSTKRACENAEREIPDFAFEPVMKKAADAWRAKLDVVEVDHHGVTEDFLTMFWSGLYRTMLSPQNYTGENQLWTSREPYFDSFYCIWDSFRAQHPLLTIIDPVAQTEMVRALLDIYRHERKLPDCRMSFCKGYTQGGSNADVVIADAWLKNITSGIDWKTAYEAVVSDAEVEPKNWGLEGRGSLVSWHNLGYLPWDDIDHNGTGPMSRTISRGVEYAYNDFCVSTLARGLGHHTDSQKYLNRSGNWKNYWKADHPDLTVERMDWKQKTIVEVTETRFVGFPQPRLTNGSFAHQNTRLCSNLDNFHGCYYDTPYDTYEGSPWLYSFFVPQDMGSLIRVMGGKAEFVERLHYFHESGISYIGNEQAFLPVFQFHYAARPGLSSYWAHQYVPGQFNASINGIPGNDDCAMGAFSSFVAMGFFPVAGQDVYLLTAPFFREVKIRTKTGKRAVIRTRNFDPSYEAIYIQSATLNGKPYHRNWITHDFFVNGGVLEYKVGNSESDWGTLDQDLPPSYPYYESSG